MEKETAAEFDKIMALIRAGTIRANEMDRRWNERHEKAMARMDRAEARLDRAEARADRADARMDKFERQLDAIRKLIQTGMKMLVENQAETRELKREMRAFLQSRNGHNGRSH